AHRRDAVALLQLRGPLGTALAHDDPVARAPAHQAGQQRLADLAAADDGQPGHARPTRRRATSARAPAPEGTLTRTRWPAAASRRCWSVEIPYGMTCSQLPGSRPYQAARSPAMAMRRGSVVATPCVPGPARRTLRQRTKARSAAAPRPPA